MDKVLEAVFRHPIRIVLLLLVPAAGGLVLGVVQPHKYQSTASLWALQKYAVINVDNSAVDPTLAYVTPAQTQAGALTDLIQTREFALSVASTAGLAAQLPRATAADPELRDDALITDIQKYTVVTAEGNSLYVVTYSNKSPSMAQRVLKCIVATFTTQIASLQALQRQNILNDYQQRLLQAQSAAQNAAQAVAAYRASHPSVASLDVAQAQSQDPQYALLIAQSQQAQSTVLNIQNNIASIKQQIAAQTDESNNTLFEVVDSPNLPVQPASSAKVLLLYAGSGLALALLGCSLYLLFAVRRDRAMYTGQDVEHLVGLPVLAQVPLLSERAVAVATIAQDTGAARNTPGA